MAYRDFETEEAKQHKDELIEKGFTLSENAEDYVFTAAPEAVQGSGVEDALAAVKGFVDAVKPASEPPPEMYPLSDKWPGERFTRPVMHSYKVAEKEALISCIHIHIQETEKGSGDIKTATVNYSSCKPPEETHKRLLELKNQLTSIASTEPQKAATASPASDDTHLQEIKRTAIEAATAAYRARYSPPTVDRVYWSYHVKDDPMPPEEERYWYSAGEALTQIGTAIGVIAGEDTRLKDELTAKILDIYSDLEKEYIEQRDSATGALYRGL